MLLLTKYTVLYKENEICCIILLSLPSRERGLKFSARKTKTNCCHVAPFAGAWIEISQADYPNIPNTSLPSRERGLKFYINFRQIRFNLVAPFAGAWIEIMKTFNITYKEIVAPFAGAWIEIW